MRNKKRSKGLSDAARKARAFAARKDEALKALRSLKAACNRSKVILSKKAKDVSAIVSRVGLSFLVNGEIGSNPHIQIDIEQAVEEMNETVIDSIIDAVKEATQS